MSDTEDYSIKKDALKKLVAGKARIFSGTNQQSPTHVFVLPLNESFEKEIEEILGDAIEKKTNGNGYFTNLGKICFQNSIQNKPKSMKKRMGV